MDIIISNSSGEAIYQQIVNQIKDMILTGKLQEGEALPSMRLLAKELRISVITTKRAYEELEKLGFIESYVGKDFSKMKKDIGGTSEEVAESDYNEIINLYDEDGEHINMINLESNDGHTVMGICPGMTAKEA